MPVNKSLKAYADELGKLFTIMYLPLPINLKIHVLLWLLVKSSGRAICSCNDGLRPVIFKLEATDASLR